MLLQVYDAYRTILHMVWSGKVVVSLKRLSIWGPKAKYGIGDERAHDGDEWCCNDNVDESG